MGVSDNVLKIIRGRERRRERKLDIGKKRKG
jgi:hypothetical protein